MINKRRITTGGCAIASLDIASDLTVKARMGEDEIDIGWPFLIAHRMQGRIQARYMLKPKTLNPCAKLDNKEANKVEVTKDSRQI